MNIQSMQLAPEVRNPPLQFLSTVWMDKNPSPTYTLQMAAQISFVSLVPTDQTTQKNVHKLFTL